MAICNLTEIERDLSVGLRLMGLDPGTKTIGIALSDTGRNIATARETLRRKRFADTLAALQAIIQSEQVGAIVVGLPINMNGTEGPRAQAARKFASNIAEGTGLPVALWDERLSSVAAERVLLEADVSRAKRAGVIDKMAAAYILQGALDRLAKLRGA